MAMPAKTPSEESSPYAVNKALFEEAAAIKEKMKMVENRLVKMDEHRNEVSEAVYFKVKTDYETQLDSVKQSFSEKCKDVEKELATLYEAQQEQETHLSGHQEVLEEARFRHTLGEFNDKKFKDLEGSQNKEIKKYGDLLEIIKSSIKQYEEILGYSYQQHFRVEAPRTSKVAAAPVTAMPAPEKKAAPSAPAGKKGAAPIEEDTARTQGKTASPPLASPLEVETGKTAFPPADTAAEKTDRAFEDKLSEDLDLFLQSEGGDYFTSEAGEAAAEAISSKAKDTAPPPPMPATSTTATAKGSLDDSLSAILKDIPFDEEPPPQVSGKAIGEETGAKIEAGSVPEASLILLEGDLEENEYILGENTSLGRSPSNDVVLKETKVSRQHAAINFRDGYYVLVDLKSSNGVFVNGKRIDEMALKDGDEVEIGSFKFQFNLS